MKLFNLSRLEPALAFVLLIGATLACGSPPARSAQIVSTATPARVLQPTFTAAPAVVLQPTSTVAIPSSTPLPIVTHLGDLVTLDGYTLSAIAVENPATKPGIFYEPEVGKRLVGVEFIVGNISGEKFASNVLRATLVDDNGFLYSAENLGGIEGTIELLDVNPGERVKGWAGFIVPEDATPVSLKYDIGGTQTTLQVGLTPR